MNCMLVVNIGNHWCLNARESIQDAAHRWKVDLIEVTSLPAGEHVWSLKHRVILERLQAYEYVYHVDTDVLIHKETPTVFAFAGKAVCAVVDNQSHYNARQHAHIAATIFQPNINRLKNLGLAYTLTQSQFVNSGVFLAPTNAPAFRYFREHYPAPEHWTAPHIEQALFNIAISQTTPLCLLAETWNRLAPPSQPPMQAHVYHFTGTGCQREALPTFDWRASRT